jgi:hypothetical protein
MDASPLKMLVEKKLNDIMYKIKVLQQASASSLLEL